MNAFARCYKNNKLSTIASVFVGFLLLIISSLGLQGCNSSSSGPLPDQNASGLYKDGTGTLNGTSVDDLVGFVSESRFIFFSVANNILIDGDITSITSDDYTATATLYVDGVMAQENFAVTGTVTNRGIMKGAFGTGLDEFTVLYDALYTRPSTLERIYTIPSVRQKKIGPVFLAFDNAQVFRFEVEDNNNYNFDSDQVTPLSTEICIHNGNVSYPDPSVNIYGMQEAISVSSFNTCVIPLTSDYTGFSSIVDGVNEDDTMLYAVTNGANSTFGIFVTKP